MVKTPPELTPSDKERLKVRHFIVGPSFFLSEESEYSDYSGPIWTPGPPHIRRLWLDHPMPAEWPRGGLQ